MPYNTFRKYYKRWDHHDNLHRRSNSEEEAKSLQISEGLAGLLEVLDLLLLLLLTASLLIDEPRSASIR